MRFPAVHILFLARPPAGWTPRIFLPFHIVLLKPSLVTTGLPRLEKHVCGVAYILWGLAGECVAVTRAHSHLFEDCLVR